MQLLRNRIVLSKNGASATTINRLIAEAKFHRAAAYAKLIVKFGDLPLVLTDVSTEEGLTMGRTDKSIVLAQIYKVLMMQLVCFQLPILTNSEPPKVLHWH